MVDPNNNKNGDKTSSSSNKNGESVNGNNPENSKVNQNPEEGGDQPASPINESDLDKDQPSPDTPLENPGPKPDQIENDPNEVITGNTTTNGNKIDLDSPKVAGQKTSDPDEGKSENQKKVEEKVKQDKLEEAIGLLNTSSKEKANLIRRLKSARKGFRKGAMTNESYNIEINRISDLILDLNLLEDIVYDEGDINENFANRHSPYTYNKNEFKNLNIQQKQGLDFQTVTDNRVTFVSCLDKDALYNFQNELFYWYSNESSQKCKFYLPDTDKENSNDLAYYEGKNIVREEPTIIIIDQPPVRDLKAFETIPSRASQIVDKLKQRNISLVLFVELNNNSDEASILHSIKKQSGNYFSYWNISYYWFILNNRFKNKDSDFLIEQIELLKKKNGIDEEYLFQSILKVKTEDPSLFIKELEKKIDQRRARDSQNESKLKKLFTNGDFLTRVALWSATFFPDIFWEEFNTVNRFFLSKPPQHALPRKIKSEEGEINELAPIDRWEERKTEILRNCLIRHKLEEDGVHVSFEQPEYGVKLKALMLESFYPFVQPLLLRISESGWIFGDFGERMLRNTVKAMTIAARYSPSTYNEEWLESLVKNIKEKFSEIDIERIQNENVFIQFLDIFQQLERNNTFKRFFLNRLTDLIKEMLTGEESSVLKKVVENFFKSIIDSSYIHDEALHLVFGLLKQLRGTPNFSEELIFGNVKRLINEGNEEQKRKTYHTLFEDLELDDLREKITKWRLESTRKENKPLKEYCYRFIFDYFIIKVFDIEEEEYGKDPPESDLLKGLTNTESKEGKYFIEYFSLLFDSQMEKAMASILSNSTSYQVPTISFNFWKSNSNISLDKAKDLWYHFLSIILEEFLMLLYGIDTPDVEELTISACKQTFWQLLLEKGTEKQLKHIIAKWKIKHIYFYSNTIAQINKNSKLKQEERKEQKKVFIKRRKRLKYFREQLSERIYSN